MATFIKKTWLILFCAAMLASAAPALARDWDDLDEGEHRIFGSEKERKFPINAGVVEYERWENHSSFHFFWFFKKTDYPRYTSFYWLPFYYHLESKIDRREKKFAWPVVPYYRVRDLDYERMSVIPFYTTKTTRSGKDTNWLYLLYYGQHRTDTTSKNYSGLIPLWYYANSHSDVTGEDRTGLITPLFFRHFNEQRGGNPEYRHLHFSPLHYYHRKRVGDRRSRTWGVPLIPLVYYHSTNEERHFNLGWLLFDLSWERASGRIQRSFMTPLWYYSHDYNSERNHSTFLTTPLWVFRHYIGPREYEEDANAAPVERRQWWFPIVPLYYRFTSTDTGSHTTILGFLDWTRDTDRKLTRLWVMPFSFYERNSYFHFLPPVVYMSWEKFTDSHYTGLWGYHHVRVSETDRNAVAMRRWWAPIVPLVYSYSTPSVHHVNVLGPLFDIQWKDDRLQRFFTLPFWYFQRDRFSDTSFETTTMSIFHHYNHYRGPREGYAGPDAPVVDRTRWWTPIIPLYYRSTDTYEGTHNNLLGLFDWANNADGSYRRFWLIPLWYHKSNSYLHILPPLYMSWVDGAAHYKASPFFFSYSVPSENRTAWWTLIIPLYYHSNSPQEGSYHNLFWLFGWQYRPDGSFSHWRLWPLAYHKSGEGGTRYYLPLYVRPGGWTEREGYSFGLPGLPYYCRWEGGETRVRHWMPLYWYWKDLTLFGKEHTHGSIVLPLWISYRDETFELDIYLYGGSKSVSMGPFAPSLMMNLGNRENTWYVDTEWSWLYNAFSISTRTPIRNPFRDRAVQPEAAMAAVAQGDVEKADAGRPRLSRRKEISRDTSLTFFGWKVLFGWLCYEQADTQRHFRVFPLYWYSWDQASDNKIFNFLIYFYSKSGDQLYHVLFPIYGFSRDGDSYFDAYALNLFWNEYDAENRRREMTFLWPFVNRYWTQGTAPDGTAESGWRFFPLIWHKYNRAADGYERSRTISPLYFGHTTSMPDNRWKRRMNLSPLHYYWSENRNDPGYTTSSSTFFFPIIPLFYKSRTETLLAARDTLPAARSFESTHFTLPFYYYTTRSDSRFDRSETTLVIPVLLTYYNTRTAANIDTRSTHDERTSSTLYIPLFYRSAEGPETHYNLGFLFDMGFNDRKGSGYHMLIPFYYYSWDNPKPGQSGSAERSFMFPLLPIVAMYEGNSTSGYWFMPFLLTYHGWERNESSWVFLGLWWTNRDTGRSERYTHFLPFWMSWSHSSYANPSETDRTVLAPFIPFICLYDGTPSNGYWLSPITLSYHGWAGTSSRWTIAGLFWKYNNYNRTDNYLHVLPIWMYWEDLNQREYDYFFPLFGLYVNTKPHKLHWNWLLLVDYEHWDSTDTTEWDFLLGIVSMRSNPRMREFEAALGLLASYENRYDSPDWHARLLWFGYERSGNRSTHNFLPLFYRRTIDGGRGYELYRFPLSFWHYESSGEDIFHAVGFGLIYYRNYYAARHRDRAMLLGGTLLNYVEKPERGYESWGSLWGFLWEYEREERGAYNKFSLMKFIFKRVDDHGDVKYRVMGVGF